MTISGPSIGTAGDDFVLICGVRVVEHLISQNIDIVHVEWSGGSLGSGNDVMKHIIHNGSYTSNTLIFNPLLPSHGARYTCQARINISSVYLLKMASDIRNIIVQSKLSCTTSCFLGICLVQSKFSNIYFLGICEFYVYIKSCIFTTIYKPTNTIYVCFSLCSSPA